jgi:hypothetical protein
MMRTISMLTAAVVVASLAQNVQAHCDSTSGPVIPEGESALASGNVTPVLKWIMPEHEDELVTAFRQAVAVRQLGPEARQLADQYFLETLVRLHRAGEGAPFTGITDDPPARIVALADEALAEASAEDMIARISALLATSIRERFTLAVEARKNKDTDVDSGRAFVEAYVQYVHYVEHVHAAIMSGGGHAH